MFLNIWTYLISIGGEGPTSFVIGLDPVMFTQRKKTTFSMYKYQFFYFVVMFTRTMTVLTVLPKETNKSYKFNGDQITNKNRAK